MVGHRDMPAAYNRSAYRCRVAALERAVATFAPSWPDVSAFTAGFGPGFYLRYLRERGIDDVWGVDLTEAAVERASARFPGYRLFQHDITQPLSLEKPRSFDLVLAIDVLFHIREDDGWSRALEHLCSLLPADGVLLLTDKFPAEGARETSPWVRWRSLEMYGDVLARSGVSIVRTMPVFLFMGEPITFGAHPSLGSLGKLQWDLLAGLASALEAWPALRDRLFRGIAALQYPVERAAVRLLDRTPNLELLVARKG